LILLAAMALFKSAWVALLALSARVAAMSLACRVALSAVNMAASAAVAPGVVALTPPLRVSCH
jgi:hypothetical protein